MVWDCSLRSLKVACHGQFYKVAASIQSRRPFFERMGWESNKYKTFGHILSKGIEKEPFC